MSNVTLNNDYQIEEYVPSKTIKPGTEYIVLNTQFDEYTGIDDENCVSAQNMLQSLDDARQHLAEARKEGDLLACILRIHRTKDGQFVLSIIE